MKPGTAGLSSGALARDRYDCTLPAPQASRAPAARYVRSRRAQATEPSSTRIRRRQGRRARPRTGLRQAAPARPLLRARRGASANPCVVAVTSAKPLSVRRSRPISTRSRARCDSSASFAPKARARSMPLGTSPGQASASARASANNTGRLFSGTTVRHRARHGGTRPR